LRVAFYYPWIYLTSGGERIIVELTRRSKHDWTLFTSHFEPENTFPEMRTRKVVELRQVSVKRDILSTAKSAFHIMTETLPMEDYDALFVMCEGLGDMIMFRNHSKPSLCYCLTPLRAAFDPVYRRQSFQKRGVVGRMALFTGLELFAAVDRLAWRRYTRTVFLSRESAARARAARLPGSDTAEILYTGVGLSAPRPSDQFEPFFLIPGRIMWTKNIELGIRAFQRFQTRHAEFGHYRLVIAGRVDNKSESYLSELRALAGGDPRIEFVVAPDDNQLRDLYSRCYGVLFTPLNEDLGIVPLEAMAFGKPVIAINQGGPTETIGHGRHGFLLDPQPDAFATCMATLIAQPEVARRIGREGFLHAAQYSWDHFAARIDDMLEEIVDRRNHSSPRHAAVARV
jgi:glycosyltransferase involved in cell wall biosynthesis